MKTPPCPRSACTRDATLAAALAAGFAIGCLAVPPLTAAPPEAKDHVLFVGTDLDVKQDGKYFHVVGATKDSLKIDKGREREDVRLGQGANLRVSKGVKLSNLSAQISEIRTESVDRGSARAQLAAMQTAMALNEVTSSDADLAFGPVSYLSGTAVSINSPSYAILQAIKKEAFDHYENKLLGINGLNDASNSYLIHQMATSSQTEVEMSFNVSAPVRIEHPYMIVVATYAVDDNPDHMARQVSARSFDHVDTHEQHVTMSHAASLNGLPFKKFDVALFANGEEVATNLSEKQMPLTSDQAFQFLLIDYLTAHKGETLPPAPRLMTPRSEFRRLVEDADPGRAIYATVDESGKVIAITADQAGHEPLPATVAAVMQHVRFMPALNEGKAVRGQVKVTLGELAR